MTAINSVSGFQFDDRWESIKEGLDGEYAEYTPGSATVCLDGNFTAIQLMAMSLFIKMSQTVCRPDLAVDAESAEAKPETE